jgi:hypothetical protein
MRVCIKDQAGSPLARDPRGIDTVAEQRFRRSAPLVASDPRDIQGDNVRAA